MTGNVLSWKQALAMGYAPRQYEYLHGSLPVDPFIAVLDFKIWAQKVLAINGYFTLEDGGQKIQLSVYLSAEQTYRIGKDQIDFFRCQTGCRYLLQTKISKTGKLILNDITPVQ
ncbi:hypothetical protein [Paraflavitalea sp. CAU 1676]|uniref:hypothetical protein n=1 Tax=Paraflavitalea sp. CAU 1676 TaxID=3032598 RepID=UPI0023DA6F76|nr:hypothetical protein [Paraflavitalea sp. CAU 1676]MDF2188680.1 hypothetical protein [Paraflavitalea sp. CAU 1676]